MNGRNHRASEPNCTGRIIRRLSGWILVWMVLGTIALAGPWSLAPGRSLNWSWLDAWFTATSAVTLTGMKLSEPSGQFSALGLGIIALLMQMGSLGVILAGCALARQWGWRLLDAPGSSWIGRVVGIVISVELIGAALLLPLWDSAMPWPQRTGWSLFHAISVFGQGGYFLGSPGLTEYRHAWSVHLVLVPLMVLGGLGLPVVLECGSRLLQRPSSKTGPNRNSEQGRLSLHSRWTLATWAGLYLLGVILLAAAQLKPTLDARLHGLTENRAQAATLSPGHLGQTIADASFLSVSARSAGLALPPMSELEPAGKWTVVGLMLMGGSPGSSAGGIQTLTLAVLLAAAVAALRRRPTLAAFGAALPDRLLRQACLMLMAYLLLIGLATFLLCLSEADNFPALLMEAASAATNRGLSSRSSAPTAMGQATVTLTMLLGRLASLACLGGLAWVAASRGLDCADPEPKNRYD